MTVSLKTPIEVKSKSVGLSISREDQTLAFLNVHYVSNAQNKTLIVFFDDIGRGVTIAHGPKYDSLVSICDETVESLIFSFLGSDPDTVLSNLA